MKCMFNLLVATMLLSVTGGAYAFAPGDLNCDGAVNVFDIDPFVEILVGGGAGEVFPVQLAGNSLTLYPFFEYVKAFNQNATIELAIDPTQHPDIVGRTADVYIVEHKSAGLWQIDPELIDMTGDGPLTVTFGGETIQDNTFVISGPNELNAAVFDPETGDFTGLGAPYDMVVDFDRDGQLSGGDYIDGLGREAGLYVVHDTTQPGPLAVTDVPSYSVGPVFGIPGSYTNEVLFYPSDIASMPPRPLIVVGHGGGHNYQWYSHIGHHMASYGYIVMSHMNCYGPPDCTLGHTDAILDKQDQIAGGVLNGKIDASRIIWIGHSLGGMGVVGAFDALMDGEYTPTHYAPDSIVLISSMLPNAMGGPSEATPHHANFHLWTAAGDTDISGAPYDEQLQTFLQHDRATKYRMSTVLQGVGHAWLHDGPAEPSFFDGPCALNKTITHRIQLGLFLPLIKYFAEGNVPASDFLWRQYERFHPIGVDTSNPCVVVSHEYRNGADKGNFFIDDYQTGPGLNVSSSGGSVTYTVHNVVEGNLDDANGDFTWSSGDPFNGATHASTGDTSRGVVFDWNGENVYYEWEVVPAARNFAAYTYLAFRGAQCTRHPYTTAVLGDLTFTVTLRDTAGTTSSINIGAYGGGFEEPYQRMGAGSGVGWHDDFEVIRIRPTDFLTNGTGLDLTNIVAVRFNFGPAWGSNEGRIVLDELMLTNDYPAYFVPMSMVLPGAAPEFVPPHVPTHINVEIFEGDDSVVAGSPTIHYRYNGGAWLSAPLERVAGELWRGTLPAPECGDAPEYYFTAQGDVSGTLYLPPSGPGNPYVSYVGNYIPILEDDFEADSGWSVQSDAAVTSGIWQRAIPGGWADNSPPHDFDGSGRCYVTDNRPTYDVDGGPTHLISPLLDLSGTDNPVMRFASWFTCDDPLPPAQDFLDVFVSSDHGATWVQAAHLASHAEWELRQVYLADFIPLTATVRVRFTAVDSPNNSLTEAGVDRVEIFDVQCD